MDPAVAYNTEDDEPIQNVYETLVAYNNSSTDTFVPVLATCVPGSPLCAALYGPGQTLIYNSLGAPTTAGGANGAPVYWSFEIDANAQFYDPGINTSAGAWSVYPSDVMFSIARNLAWSDLPSPSSFPGWILGQSLLPGGNPTWDESPYTGAGSHAPYNSTPGNILGSMLINDSAYCPVGPDSNGCITFDANGWGLTGSAQNWPLFLDYIADPLGGSVVPCGWFSFQTGNALPGFWADTQANATEGEGSCVVAGLTGNAATSGTTWSNYLTALSAPGIAGDQSWDAFANLANNEIFAEAPQSVVINTMVGSGPYYMGTPLTAGYDGRGLVYDLTKNPDYVQPYACQAAQLSGYSAEIKGQLAGCYPAAGSYVPNVQVTYTAGSPTSDAATLAAYKSGALDVAGFSPADVSFLPTGKTAGYLNYFTAPTGSSYSDFFIPFNLEWSEQTFISDDFGSPPTVPANFFTGLAAREFLATAFPYETAYTTLYKTSGITLQYATGGPAPFGMSSSAPGLPGLYPENVSYPGSPNATTDTSSNAFNSSINPLSFEYWWINGRTSGNPEYDPELAACTKTSVCTIDLFGEAGDTDLNAALQDWAADIKTDSGGALVANYEVLTFAQLIVNQAYATPGSGPADVWNLGWAPDYANPYDYYLPMEFPNETYTNPDAVYQALTPLNTGANALTCTHTDPATYANLVYWAKNPIPEVCQGFAYDVANYWANHTQVAAPSSQALLYNLAAHIYNNLSLYVWQGQANLIPAFAPWINPATIDTNPCAGGTQLWFKVGYITETTVAVTFHEIGLPNNVGVEWGVARGTSALGAANFVNASVASPVAPAPPVGANGRTITLNLPTGVASPFTPYVFLQPTSGPWYNYSNASVASPDKFTAATNVYLLFTELGNVSVGEHGLADTVFAAPSWCATFTSQALNPTAPVTACSNPALPISSGSNQYLTATLPAGTYKATLTATGTGTAGYGICTETTAASAQDFCTKTSGGTNTLNVTTLTAASTTITVPGEVSPLPAAEANKSIVFYPVNEKVTFSMTGVPVGTVWSVQISSVYDPGPTNWSLTPGFPLSLTGGTYTFYNQTVYDGPGVVNHVAVYNYTSYDFGTTVITGNFSTAAVLPWNEFPTGYTLNVTTLVLGETKKTYTLAENASLLANDTEACGLIGYSMTGANGTIAAHTQTFCDIAGYNAVLTGVGDESLVFTVLQSPNPYTFTVSVSPTSGYVPSISSGTFSPTAAKTISIAGVDPKAHHAVLYVPEAVRRSASLPSVGK